MTFGDKIKRIIIEHILLFVGILIAVCIKLSGKEVFGDFPIIRVFVGIFILGDVLAQYTRRKLSFWYLGAMGMILFLTNMFPFITKAMIERGGATEIKIAEKLSPLISKKGREEIYAAKQTAMKKMEDRVVAGYKNLAENAGKMTPEEVAKKLAELREEEAKLAGLRNPSLGNHSQPEKPKPATKPEQNKKQATVQALTIPPAAPIPPKIYVFEMHDRELELTIEPGLYSVDVETIQKFCWTSADYPDNCLGPEGGNWEDRYSPQPNQNFLALMVTTDHGEYPILKRNLMKSLEGRAKVWLNAPRTAEISDGLFRITLTELKQEEL